MKARLILFVLNTPYKILAHMASISTYHEFMLNLSTCTTIEGTSNSRHKKPAQQTDKLKTLLVNRNVLISFKNQKPDRTKLIYIQLYKFKC